MVLLVLYEDSSLACFMNMIMATKNLIKSKEWSSWWHAQSSERCQDEQVAAAKQTITEMAKPVLSIRSHWKLPTVKVTPTRFP